MRNEITHFSSNASPCGSVPGEKYDDSIVDAYTVLIAKPQELAADCMSGCLLIKQKRHIIGGKFEITCQFGKDGFGVIDCIAEGAGVLVPVDADD